MSATTVLLVIAAIACYVALLAFALALLGAAKRGDEIGRAVAARSEPPIGPNDGLRRGRFTIDDAEFLQTLDRQASSALGAAATPRHQPPG